MLLEHAVVINKQAQKMMTHGVTTKWQWDVSSAQYLPVLDPPVRREIPANDAQWDWDVAWNVLTIITTWLKIPAESLAYHIRQGGLVSSIVHVLGKEALLLPAVWELGLQADSMLSSSWCNHP